MSKPTFFAHYSIGQQVKKRDGITTGVVAALYPTSLCVETGGHHEVWSYLDLFDRSGSVVSLPSYALLSNENRHNFNCYLDPTFLLRAEISENGSGDFMFIVYDLVDENTYLHEIGSFDCIYVDTAGIRPKHIVEPQLNDEVSIDTYFKVDAGNYNVMHKASWYDPKDRKVVDMTTSFFYVLHKSETLYKVKFELEIERERA